MTRGGRKRAGTKGGKRTGSTATPHIIRRVRACTREGTYICLPSRFFARIRPATASYVS
eukprot:CAMPEP_0195017662 /NCGR_PEP_ID=MMETSP0326_2-20130528/28166_1 /TAXON_ID=2866 ORGANISM="Crypthecodinium cohnii, Strain Seligo" /NCGR_SAMPLE_ID=MMETSP0326_2 /ASSEMBLY_ACC=CAM_ASM_000348 /LENGTH=58 /DNA_ID=CAMNT_0040034499 /DNA_START=22 /DNA_END=195 /DNA_ORIENTATION=+